VVVHPQLLVSEPSSSKSTIGSGSWHPVTTNMHYLTRHATGITGLTGCVYLRAHLHPGTTPSTGFLTADLCAYHCPDVWHPLSHGVLLIWAGCGLSYPARGQPRHPWRTGGRESLV